MKKNILWAAGVFILLIVLGASGASGLFSRNLWNLQALKAIFSPAHGSEALAADLSERTPQDCQEIWLAIQLTPLQDHFKDYRAVLDCSADYTGLVASRRPLDVALALQAVGMKPQEPNVWLWLAKAQAAAGLPEALVSMRQAEALDRESYDGWCQIGVTFEQNQQLTLARDANLQCCAEGAHGPVGCYRAGLLEEKLGNPRKAIEDYRFTGEAEWLKRADALEKQLKP